MEPVQPPAQAWGPAWAQAQAQKIAIAGHAARPAGGRTSTLQYERSLLLRGVALAFYASSVDSGSASGWVRYGFVQTVALASAFLALESARLSSKAKLARAGHAR